MAAGLSSGRGQGDGDDARRRHHPRARPHAAAAANEPFVRNADAENDHGQGDMAGQDVFDGPAAARAADEPTGAEPGHCEAGCTPFSNSDLTLRTGET